MVSVTEEFYLMMGGQKRAGGRGTRKGEGEAKRRGTRAARPPCAISSQAL